MFTKSKRKITKKVVHILENQIEKQIEKQIEQFTNNDELKISINCTISITKETKSESSSSLFSKNPTLDKKRTQNNKVKGGRQCLLNSPLRW